MNKILIIDDDRELCALIKRSVQAENIEADFCNTGKEGLQKLREQEYQLVVLDVMMPGMDGFETLEEIRKEYSLPILMFTSKNDSISKVRGLRAGADDYLVKPFSFLELLARLQVITKRVRTKEQTNIYIGDLHIDLLARRATRGSRRLDLTAKEFSLLEVLAQRQSQIVSKTVITELVWDICFDTNTNVVEATVKRLRAKLEQEGEPKLLHTIRGMGYVLEQR